MMTTPSFLAATAATAALVLAGCSSTPISTPEVATAPSTTTAATTTAAPPSASTAPAAASTVTTVQLPAYLDPASGLADRSVFFEYDSTTLDSQDTALIDRHSRFLASAPDVKIRVEGNGDERGSAEYNLALGQRRAETVARALKLAGARDSQLEVVSWGEEKPRNPGHDEAAWAQNRRADLVYPAR